MQTFFIKADPIQDRLKRIVQLENQATTPFMIATDNDTTARDLGNYLGRQYPDDVIVYFPEKRGYFFTQPFVIAGGIITIMGLWYFLFKRGY